MRRWLPVLLLVFAASLSYAQNGEEEKDTNPYDWDIQGSFNLGLNQNTYSDNWAGDEIGSASWISSFNLIAEKKISEMLDNRSTLRMEFGQTHQKDPDTDDYRPPFKSADKIDLESVFGFEVDWPVNPYASARIQSQFVDQRGGTDDPYYFNPATFTEAVGVSRTFIKKEKQDLRARLGLATRQIVDGNWLDPETDTRHSETIYDAGFEFVSELNTPVTTDDLMLTAKLTLYQALHSSLAEQLEGTPEEDYWKAMDVDFETIFTGTITETIKVTLQTRLLYDKEIDKGGRFKESLSVGIGYTFSN